MSHTHNFEELSEVEAAIVLYIATVVADGEVHPNETHEFVQQIKLVTGKSDNSKADFELNLSDFLTHLSASDEEHPLRLDQEQVRFIAGLVFSEELKITVMNAIFEIAFSDDDYHNSEREIVGILRECWGI